MSELKELSEERKEQMKVEHYTLHLPPTLLPEQLEFIETITKKVANNELVNVIHEKAVRFLLRLAYNYRNILTEFDEQDRWTKQDDEMLEWISTGFKHVIDYLIEQYKLDISKFERD